MLSGVRPTKNAVSTAFFAFWRGNFDIQDFSLGFAARMAVSVSLNGMGNYKKGQAISGLSPLLLPNFADANGSQRTSEDTKKRKSPLCSRLCGLFRTSADYCMAEGVGFEPTYRLITGNSISSRARYGRFATPPQGRAGSAIPTGKAVYPVLS